MTKKYAILTFWAKGMSNGTAPDETSPARLNEGKVNSASKNYDGTAMDLIKDENGKIIQFVSQVDALNYCVKLGWDLEQTLFESNEGFNSRDPYSSFIFILSRHES